MGPDIEGLIEIEAGKPKPFKQNTEELIMYQCDLIRDMLIDKNRKYGDSAMNPVRIFSSAHRMEQLNVRMDDKLSRIAAAQSNEDEDPELDLIGYLILKRIARMTPDE